jgi:hypothetical protein
VLFASRGVRSLLSPWYSVWTPHGLRTDCMDCSDSPSKFIRTAWMLGLSADCFLILSELSEHNYCVTINIKNICTQEELNPHSVLRSGSVRFLDNDGPQPQPQPVATAPSCLGNRTEPHRTGSYQSGCGSPTDFNRSDQRPVRTSCYRS